MASTAAPMFQLAAKDLEFLRRAIKKRQIPTPITRLALKSVGKEKLFDRLGPLATAGRETALALIDMALAGGTTATTSSPELSTAQLAWTGPEVHLSEARPTTALVLDLLGSAKEEVLIVGYEFDHGGVLFEPLHEAMRDRGVRASLFIDVRPAPSPKTHMSAYLALQSHKFLKRNWPFGSPIPALYYFPAGAQHGSCASLHAKCMVVDGRHVLVGSANFTQRGHARNIEVGICLDDRQLAATVARQLEQLVDTGELSPLPPPAAPSVRPPEELAPEDEPSEADPHEALADELLVADEIRAFFLRVTREGLPVPEVGEDIASAAGAVLGTAELSWERARVAVLLAEQEGSRKALEAADWSCFSLQEAIERFDAMRQLIDRGG